MHTQDTPHSTERIKPKDILSEFREAKIDKIQGLF